MCTTVYLAFFSNTTNILNVNHVFKVTDCVGCPSHIKNRTDQSEFSISVEDENDNAPYFEWNVETVEVAENAGELKLLVKS